MSDLTKELPVEKLTEESWTADKNERRVKIASRNAVNMNEKSIFRQMGWCNTFTDQLGDIIRHVKALSLDDKPDTAEEKFFNASQKQAILEKLRATVLANNRNSGYLALAKDYGYEAADDFESSNSSEITMDESTATMVDKIAKKYSAKIEKSRRSPYKTPNHSGRAQNYQFMQQQPFYEAPMFQQHQQVFQQQPQMFQQQPQTFQQVQSFPSFSPSVQRCSFPRKRKGSRCRQALLYLQGL